MPSANARIDDLWLYWCGENNRFLHVIIINFICNEPNATTDNNVRTTK